MKVIDEYNSNCQLCLDTKSDLIFILEFHQDKLVVIFPNSKLEFTRREEQMLTDFATDFVFIGYL